MKGALTTELHSQYVEESSTPTLFSTHYNIQSDSLVPHSVVQFVAELLLGIWAIYANTIGTSIIPKWMTTSLLL